MSFWNAELQQLMDEALVPGAAAAIVRDGHLAEVAGCGVRHVRSPLPVDAYTVFDAASLSKPVFAYLVLQLVDQGKLKLDTLLADSLPSYIVDDPRAASITIDHVLSHSAGLPNWRNPDYPLRTYFQPGERFSYSGEGFLYLQRVIETVAGEKLDRLAQSLVFGPLGMNRSSFVWERRFHDNRAYSHDAYGTPALGNKPAEANAAWSLQTCAADYARFLIGVLQGAGLRPETAELWLRPRIHVKHRGIQCLGPSAEDVITGVAWGLGWGLEPASGMFFHWGDNGPFTAFTLGSLQRRAALVIFTNGASGLSIMSEMVAHFEPGNRPSLEWLDYARHDAPVRRMLRATLAHGVEAAWREIEKAALKREDLIWIAQGLNARGREKESLWLRERAGAK
jgi:CubicO group peptidase (beta-lactamase class C family)